MDHPLGRFCTWKSSFPSWKYGCGGTDAHDELFRMLDCFKSHTIIAVSIILSHIHYVTYIYIYKYICMYVYVCIHTNMCSPKHDLQKQPCHKVFYLPHFTTGFHPFLRIQETLCAIDLHSAKVKMTGLSWWDTPIFGSSDATNLSSGTLIQTTHCSST